MYHKLNLKNYVMFLFLEFKKFPLVVIDGFPHF